MFPLERVEIRTYFCLRRSLALSAYATTSGGFPAAAFQVVELLPYADTAVAVHGFNQQPAQMKITGFGNGTPVARVRAGVLPRDQTQKWGVLRRTGNTRLAFILCRLIHHHLRNIVLVQCCVNDSE